MVQTPGRGAPQQEGTGSRLFQACLLVTDRILSPPAVLHLQLHPGLHFVLRLPADKPGTEGHAADSGLGGLPAALQPLPMLAHPRQQHRNQQYT